MGFFQGAYVEEFGVCLALVFWRCIMWLVSIAILGVGGHDNDSFDSNLRELA